MLQTFRNLLIDFSSIFDTSMTIFDYIIPKMQNIPNFVSQLASDELELSWNDSSYKF
jgi:hypothetical protein